MKTTLHSASPEETLTIGRRIGAGLVGGELIELRSDLGGGKTTLTRGIAEGLGSSDPVSSPSFTICNTYRCKDGLRISHFDFYRLTEPGIVANELDEVLGDSRNITVIEWPGIVEGVLPEAHISIKITSSESGERTFLFEAPETNTELQVALEELAS